MARKPQHHFPTRFYHVMLRGNNGQDIFLNDVDRHRLYDLLWEGIERFDHRIHGFCLMTNHIHLIIQIGHFPLSQVMHHLTTNYAIYFNYTYKRVGHLFQGRFRRKIVDAENYLAELSRYVHLNPVRAGLVSRPEEYRWSSHNAFLDRVNIPWLYQEWILRKFDIADTSARARFEEFVMKGIGESPPPQFELGVHKGRIIDEDSFIKRILSEVNDQLQNNLPTSPSLEDILDVVVDATNLSVAILRSIAKRPEIAQARGIAALLVRENPRLALKDLASLLVKDSGTLNRQAKAVEQKAKTHPDLSLLIQQIRAKL